MPAEQHVPRARKKVVLEPRVCIAHICSADVPSVPEYPPLGFTPSVVSNTMISLEKGKNLQLHTSVMTGETGTG